MTPNIFNFICIIALLFNSSCASILSGTTDTIYVRSEVPGTQLYLNNTLIAEDDGKVVLRKKDLKGSKLVAKKIGCESSEIEINTRFDKTSLLGIFLDLGIISILIVDWGIYGSVRKAEKLNYVLSPNC